MRTTLPGFPRPLIALVGRPNVGKSTLFNRLLGSRRAVVSSTGGTTRDRLYGLVEWRGTPFTLIDMGGMEFGVDDGIGRSVQRHVVRALEEADGVVFVCDAQEGLVPADQMIMEWLRKTGKPVLLTVNKADHRLIVPPDFFSLGLAQPLAVSALHGRGTGELLDRLVDELAQRSGTDPQTLGSRLARAVAIVGRQNVGKSSLLNALLREERVIVSEVPGTTRDAVDTHLVVDGELVTVIDTAGLRHRRKVKDPVDMFSMSGALEAIGRCDVALVVLDATQGLVRDDQRILTSVCRAGRGLVVLVNKWDLVKGGTERTLTEATRRAAPFVSFAPVLAVSAKTGFQVPRILTTTMRVIRTMQRGVSDVECRAILEEAWAAHQSPRFRGRTVRLRGARWLPGVPVRVELITSPIGRLPLPYQHYLLKRLYAHPSISGVPIKLVVTGTGKR